MRRRRNPCDTEQMAGNQAADRLLTRSEVERRVGLGRTTLYRMMRSGKFPEPFKVGPTAVRWSLREIEAWAAALERSHGDGIHRAGQR